MSRVIKNTLGSVLLISMLMGCSMTSVRMDDITEESFENNQQYTVLSEEINQMIENYSKLENKVKEQTKELERQRKLLRLLPQAWQTAERFLEAYVELDFDTLDELTTDDYLIEEKGIILSELSTETPYLSLRYDKLDYLLNNFDLAPDVTPDQVRMNISFYLINSDSEIENIVYMNLRLEKIGEIWQVAQVEL